MRVWTRRYNKVIKCFQENKNRNMIYSDKTHNDITSSFGDQFIWTGHVMRQMDTLVIKLK